MNLYDYVISIPDYPKKGIIFRDITPILDNGDAFAYVISKIAEDVKRTGATKIAGPEARGFLFGAAVAAKLNLGFVPVRKPGKLPREVISIEYDCEYAKNTLCMHKDALNENDKVYIIDDLLATGGTVEASIKLAKKLGANVVGCGFVIELIDLKGREKISVDNISSLLQFEGE